MKRESDSGLEKHDGTLPGRRRKMGYRTIIGLMVEATSILSKTMSIAINLLTKLQEVHEMSDRRRWGGKSKGERVFLRMVAPRVGQSESFGKVFRVLRVVLERLQNYPMPRTPDVWGMGRDAVQREGARSEIYNSCKISSN